MRPTLVVLVAAVVAVAGCRDGDERKEALEDYVRTANRTQAQFELSLRQAQQSIRAFADGRTTPRTAERLRQASSTILANRSSLALIEPPAEARALHAALLELLDLQRRLTLEVSLAADYSSNVAAAIRPAQTAATTLGRRLRSAKTGEQQAVALTTYAGEVTEALAALDALGVPPFLRPWHDDRRERLTTSRRDALALAAGIRRQDSDAVTKALESFTAREPDDVLRKAQAEAVKTFNERLDEQDRLLERIYREQAELAEWFAG